MSAPSPPEARPKTPNAWEWKRYAFKLEVELRELQQLVESWKLTSRLATKRADEAEAKFSAREQRIDEVVAELRRALAASSEEPG